MTNANTPNTFSAPDALRSWIVTESASFNKYNVTTELRCSDDPQWAEDYTDASKALLSLEAFPIIGTLTIWGSGAIEYLAVNASTGTELDTIDFDGIRAEMIGPTLSELLERFLRHCDC